MKVVDASVGFKWIIPEDGSERAIEFQSEELIAPDFFPIELTNALRTAEIRGRVHDSQTLLDDFLLQLPELHDSVPILPRALEIARAARRSVYDSLYVALAEREQCELVTADQKLYISLRNLFPFVV